MHIPSFLSAGFALTATAFLLPPEAASKLEAAKQNIVPTLISPQARKISLDCSSCPFALESQRNGQHEWTNAVKSNLELRFEAKDNQLKLNGVPFYPITPPFTPALITAKQTEKSQDTTATSPFKGYNGELRLSYSLEVGSKKKNFPIPGQDATATEITLSILGLDSEVIHVDDIKIKALSLPNPVNNGKHELIIVSVDTVPADGNAPDAQCSTIFCRVMYKFKSAVNKVQSHAKTAAHNVKCACIKGINAMRHGYHHRRPHQADDSVHLPTHNRIRPGYFKPHHPHHRQHHSWVQSFARATRQIFSYVILPILVGIVFGIAASAIGMLVGQVIVSIWLRLRRNSSNKVAYEPVETEEKEGLPRYEDLEDSKMVIDEKA